MTFKEGDKLPLIAKNPDNSGAYSELFSLAAEKIGCKITITRLPKKRLHRQLEKGELDFYPGASFSNKRAEYLYYIDNGFTTAEYGITSINSSEIFNFQQVKEFNLIWLMELGSSKNEPANKNGVQTMPVRFADIEKARYLISKGRNIFYIADKELVDYYLKRTGYRSFKDAGLKVHYGCCGDKVPMYMGFSRLSPHFKERPNPKYDKTKKLSPSNSPTVIDPGCVAYKLGQALMEIKASGKTAQIYQKYFLK